MNKGKFEFLIVSSPEREKVFCEIYYKSGLLAEISQETSELRLEIFASNDAKWWDMPLLQFQDALEEARFFLLGLSKTN